MYVEIAKKHELDPSQLAIRFCDIQPFVTSTIIGATTMEQLKACIDSIHLDLNKEIMNEMDLIIGNDLEFNVADNSTNGLELAKVYIKKKPSVIVYKMGEEGSKVFTKENESQYGTFNVEAIKPTGAGDAFNGGFISSLYNGLSLEDAVIRGSANAAIVVTRVGCSSAMPNNQELEKFINQNQKEL